MTPEEHDAPGHPLDLVRLLLGPECVVERLVELGAEPRHAGSLFLALGRQPLRVGGEPELDLPQHLMLSLLELGDPHLRRLGGAIEILRPLGEPVFDLRLNFVELLAEGGRRVVLPLGDERPALLGDLALLFFEQRARVGACARKRELELGPERALLAFDSGEEIRFGLNETVVHRSDASQRAA